MSTGIQTCQTKQGGKWHLKIPNKGSPHKLERNLPSRGWGRVPLIVFPFRYLSEWANPLLYQIFAQILPLSQWVLPWQPNLNCELLPDLHCYAVLCSVAGSPLTLWDPSGCSPPGSSVHGIFHARTLEWDATPFCRGSPQFKDWSHISCVSYVAGILFTNEPPGKPLQTHSKLLVFLK